MTLKSPYRPLSFLILFILLIISGAMESRHFTYFVIGGLLGAGLNYFQFGFRTCSQQLLVHGKTLGIRSVLVMLAVTTLLFFPLLNAGHFGNQTLTGFIEPLSLSVVVGAFLFGMGMQLSNGCTSGTLNKLGQLNPLSFSAFIFLIIGGTCAAYGLDFWRNLPALPAVSLIQSLGLFPALILQLGVIGLLYRFVRQREKSRHQHVAPLLPRSHRYSEWHPWLIAGLFLALLNTLLLMLSGQPWSIASALPVWGVKLGSVIGLPIDFSFWDYSITYSQRLDASIWTDTVSLTTLGLIFGAGLVSLLNRSVTNNALADPWTTHLFAMFGGFIMGYGAVISFGCNIGAFFSGIGSGSLHGWLWAIAALAGNALIITLKKRSHLMQTLLGNA